jgi:hypothetical protein
MLDRRQLAIGSYRTRNHALAGIGLDRAADVRRATSGQTHGLAI